MNALLIVQRMADALRFVQTLLGPTLARVTNPDMFCLMWMVDLATPFSLQMMETGQEMFIILDIAVFVSVRHR